MTDAEAIRKLLIATLTAYRSQRVIDARDLRMLVEVALRHEEISSSKAAELLGLTIKDMRVLSSEWFGPVRVVPPSRREAETPHNPAK